MVFGQNIDLAALQQDLSVSYVDTYVPPPDPPKPERQRWINPNKDQPEDLPRGWSPEEPDLDETDYDAQIERCNQRVKDNIMPDHFKEKRKHFKKLMTERDARMARFPGLSLKIVERLDVLQEMRGSMVAEGDEDDNVCNVDAIIAAYKAGALGWNKGLVTYWSKGVQLCQPRPFDWEEFLVVNHKNDGSSSFWVEGGDLSESHREDAAPKRVTTFSPASDYGCYQPMKISLRVPESNNTAPDMPFSMIDDTGSQFMTVYREDVGLLRALVRAGKGRNPPVPILGRVQIQYGNGTAKNYTVVCLEPNIFDHNLNYMCATWRFIQVLVRPGNIRLNCTGPRLVGPWLRNMLYTATTPDNMFRLTVSTHKGALTASAPAADPLAGGVGVAPDPQSRNMPFLSLRFAYYG